MEDFGNLHLLVKAGGRQANFSPVPWVRVYSKRYAPTAQEGIYLVYLFAADGSAACLSLNQGTSEFRSGHMRSIENRNVLFSRAAQARSALGDLMESQGSAVATLSIDLASKTLTSRDSRLRARAYEDANVLAHDYITAQIPSDEQLVKGLYGMLPLLARLYGEVPVQPLSAVQVPTQDSSDIELQVTGKSKTQGRLLDSATRKKIEVYAEDCAAKHFYALGWKMGRVGHLKLGYDLSCTKGNDEILHVEVKGTQTRGQR
jgi:methionine-rich copper-binding protein CopC